MPVVIEQDDICISVSVVHDQLHKCTGEELLYYVFLCCTAETPAPKDVCIHTTLSYNVSNLPMMSSSLLSSSATLLASHQDCLLCPTPTVSVLIHTSIVPSDVPSSDTNIFSSISLSNNIISIDATSISTVPSLNDTVDATKTPDVKDYASISEAIVFNTFVTSRSRPINHDSPTLSHTNIVTDVAMSVVPSSAHSFTLNSAEPLVFASVFSSLITGSRTPDSPDERDGISFNALVIISCFAFNLLIFGTVIVYIVTAKLCYNKGRQSTTNAASAVINSETQSNDEIMLRNISQSNEQPVYEDIDADWTQYEELNVSGATISALSTTIGPSDPSSSMTRNEEYCHAYDTTEGVVLLRHNHTQDIESTCAVLQEACNEDDHIYINNEATSALVDNTDVTVLA